MSWNIFKIFVLSLFIFPAVIYSQIYHIDISGTIDMGLPPYVERVIREAEADGASAILLEVNTFGGRVDAATELKDLLLNTNLETIAFINKRAISAGALISLSCKTIGMVPGSSIGAATVVDQGGKKAPEKAISYFRAEMGATAERNGRNRKIAEGMVDEDIEVEGLSEKGKLVTLTADDAIKWKMADYIAPTMNAFLDSLGLRDENVIYTKPSWAEDVVRFLTGPIISSALISLGLLGLFFEIKSPGWGLPGTLGLLFLALFFGSHYIIKLASFIEIILFFIGVALLLLEIFVIPGFGFSGIAGIICIVAGIYLSLVGALENVTWPDLGNAAYRLGLALLVTIGGAVLLARFGPRTSLWRKLSLQDEQKRDEGYVASKDYRTYIGKTGIAISPLRPAGLGQFGEERLDVVTEGEFIEQNAPIKIIRVEGYRLVVRENKGALK
jgi:membrane-bound serine protease (ClpP class)